MSEFKAEAVICGAGIAGVAVAFQLAVVAGIPDVVVIDPLPPLSLTSDKSTECYRNWWPGPDGAMIALMNRSCERLEAWAAASDNRFHLNQRGYLYLTRRPEQVGRWHAVARAATDQGAGTLRVHEAGASAYRPSPQEGWMAGLDGADLLLGHQLHRHFPYLDPALVAGLHVRRAGWLSAQQLGMWWWEQARAHGARLVEGEVIGVMQRAGHVVGVDIATSSGTHRLATERFVDAAGPYLAEVAALLGVSLPLYSELHAKIAIHDALGAVPRHAPMLICEDEVTLPWDEEERTLLGEDPALRWLLEPLPPGAHLRPEGSGNSRTVLLLWPYHTGRYDQPHFPCDFSATEPEIVLRGAAALIPALGGYLDPLPRPVVDGGYYTRTADNRPLIGPLPVAGAFVLGALSGYGIMAAPAAAELLAAHLLGAALPDYAPAFTLDRYTEPGFAARMAAWGDGQL